MTGGVRIDADSVPLVRFLQTEIEYLLYKPFADTSLPVSAATFETSTRKHRLRTCSEIAHSDKDEIRLSWSGFLEPFNFAADPGFAAGLVRALLTADRNQEYVRLQMTEEQRAATPATDFRPSSSPTPTPVTAEIPTCAT